MTAANRIDVKDLSVPLDRDGFLRDLLRQLSGVLEEVVGLEDAAGFISVVGIRIADQIDSKYKSALQTDKLDREQVADVMVDLKRRIQGDFYIIEADEEKIVLGNRACPFGDRVLGRPSLCMMTSNVFGHITAQNLGYARVNIEEAIAYGDKGCRVVVYLNQDNKGSDTNAREYFNS